MKKYLKIKEKELKLTTLGFTLIELLAVIVILAIIALIAVPVIMNIIAKANKSAFKDSAYGIIKAGELYYSEKLLEVDGMTEDVTFTFPEANGLAIKGSRPVSGNMKVSVDGDIALAISNGKYCITKSYNDTDVNISEDIDNCIMPVLINNVTVEENIMINIGETKKINITLKPDDATNKELKWTSLNESIATVDKEGNITGVELGDTVVTVETQDGSNIKKEINIQVGYKNGIMRSPSNCINIGTCGNGTRVLTEVNNTEKYNFYTIKDESNNLTMIMDRNLGGNIAWINKEDYEAVGGTNYGTAGRNEKGPLTALKALKERTSNWTNIELYSYTLIDDKPDAKGSQVMYQPIKDIDAVTNVRTRMLTYTEAVALGCKFDVEKSCPSYLYEKSNYSTTGTNSLAYWLSTSISDPPYASQIHLGGFASLQYVDGHYSTWGLSFGIRPVISVPKNQ